MTNKFCSFCALHGIICDIHRELRNEYNSLNPTYATAQPIAQHIEQLSSTFKFHQQGDPSEFLVVLLDHLMTCVKTNETDVDMNSSLQPIQQIFGLNIISIIECKICCKTSSVDTWESILSLSMSSYSNLRQSLSAYFTIEELKNGDLYSCSNCEKMVPFSKMLKISNESPVIFILLKRFDYDVRLNSTRKSNLVIAYPETITLDDYFDEISRQSNKENENHSFIYKLNSVVVHLGEYATNGHVYAYVCSPDGYWYKADDERLTPVDLDLVLNHKDAYILCYVKTLKNSIYFSDNETISSPTHSSPVKISSTPTVSFQYFDKARDTHDDEILLSEIESISSNNSMNKISIDDNSFAGTCSSHSNDDILSDDSSIQHCSTQPESMILSTSIDTSSIQLDEDVQDSQSENDFVAETPTSHQFNLRSVDLVKLQVIRTEKNNMKKKRQFEKMGLIDESSNKTTAKKIFISKQVNTFKATVDNLVYNGDSSIHIGSTAERKCHVDVTYFYILLPYIKQLNKFCGLCVLNCTFGATNDAHRILLRCKLRCRAHPICPFTCFAIVQNNGKGNIIVTNRKVRHIKGVKICRPTRKPLRNLIKQQFAQGASTYRMYQEKLQQRTPEQRQGQNYDGIGKSRCILSKIKSERVNDSLLSADVDQGLFKLLEKFRADYNSDGKVKGSIQFISKYPCQIIVYSESSIRLFDLLMKQKNVVLSLDATGSIIKEKNTNRLLYYELSATLPGVANQDSIIPITFMISNAHALVNVIHWLELFKYSFSQMVIDEEQQFNTMDSPFKSTIIHDRTSRGILKWFRYLIFSFMPTTPIWSNLLLGDLSRHNRQIIHSFENIATNNEEQRTTAISERRMNIVKRNQLVMNSHQQVFLKCPYYLISCTTAIPSINTTTTTAIPPINTTTTTTMPSINTTTTAIPPINTTTTKTMPSINTTAAVPSTIDNNTASASSHMRIVSQTNVNGVKRLVITDDNHFFSITTPTNTKTS
ncbi:unnamed protein product [Rotaria magnacalcarata]|uniref:Ubiquitin carboxyl-terminal hydrolase 36 n=1 Tax=Rotaria magnacalcarata TaxID=392030 RepID=A0A816A658_9BILA|nr:unnamed protein product [Rotaria magnacalcarata]CAF3995700.1 unnamed protein product [Rotaria magnacalcarata]CAF4001796.1 unnamed protein product [Rotaria magnacalcarata]CAF4039022.1 unnamed protein product [Rotaria magnacalcarata]